MGPVRKKKAEVKGGQKNADQACTSVSQQRLTLRVRRSHSVGLYVTQHDRTTCWERNQAGHRCSDHTCEGVKHEIPLPPSPDAPPPPSPPIHLHKTQLSPHTTRRILESHSRLRWKSIWGATKQPRKIAPHEAQKWDRYPTPPRGPAGLRGRACPGARLPQTMQHWPCSSHAQHDFPMRLRNSEF